ncbi:hypothetical protein WA158_008091 [Blastocystis sp. Blastoise]
MDQQIIEASDYSLLTSLIIDAFQNEPFSQTIIRRDEKHTWAEETMWKTVVDITVEKGNYHAWVDQNYRSAIIWSEDKKHSEASWFYKLKKVPSLYKVVGGFKQAYKIIHAFQKLRKHQYKGHQIYVYVLGVVTNAQHMGLGSTILKKLMDYADDNNLPITLETSTENNVRFYEKHGFIVLEKREFLKEGPPVWLMLRPALLSH